MNDGRPRDSAQPGGARSKWLLGAAAAAVLFIGGYVAWTNFAPSEDRTQSTDVQPSIDLTPAPTLNQNADSEENAALESETTPETAAPPARRRAPAQSAAIVPEETIGIAPEGVTPPSSDEDEIVVTAPRRPIWTRRPNAHTLSALYPVRALERGRDGEARLHCTVLDGGALDCERTEESRAEFGAAALRVARTLRHAPTLADGSTAIGTPVNLRVVFRMERGRRG